MFLTNKLRIAPFCLAGFGTEEFAAFGYPQAFGGFIRSFATGMAGNYFSIFSSGMVTHGRTIYPETFTQPKWLCIKILLASFALNNGHGFSIRSFAGWVKLPNCGSHTLPS